VNGPCGKCQQPSLAPDNQQGLAVFMASLTQTRKSTFTQSGMGGSVSMTRVDGLDYAGAEAAARGLGIEWRDVFGSVRMAESEWLAILREQIGNE